MAIGEKEILARNGNIEDKKELYYHYFYIVEKFYKANKDILSYEEIIKIYNELFQKYFILNLNGYMDTYIQSGISKEIKILRADEKKEGTTYLLIEKAKHGDIKARNELVLKYTDIVYKKAKKYIFLNKEDLIQQGLLKLVEIINFYVKGSFKMHIATYIDQTLETYFKNEQNQYLEILKITQPQKDYIIPEEQGYIDQNIEMVEINDFIDSNNLNPIRNEIIKKVMAGYGETEIAGEMKKSRAFVYYSIYAAGKVLKKTYKG